MTDEVKELKGMLDYGKKKAQPILTNLNSYYSLRLNLILISEITQLKGKKSPREFKRATNTIVLD